MDQDDTELAAAAAQMAAAAALHRKTPGKAGLPTLLLLRGDISKTTKTSKQNKKKKEFPKNTKHRVRGVLRLLIHIDGVFVDGQKRILFE